MTDTAELRRLLAEATQPPWRFVDSGDLTILIEEDERPNTEPIVLIDENAWPGAERNFALIVAAVNALPGLLDRIEELEAVAEAARACHPRRDHGTCLICDALARLDGEEK